MADQGPASMYDRAKHAAQTISARTSIKPRVAIVLGSGLGAFADEFEDSVAIPYREIPGFVSSTAQGHVGSLVIGKVQKRSRRGHARTSALL